MRRANQELGWLENEGNEGIFGIALGFDFCAEHECSARYIKEQLGIPEKDIPIGVEDRTMTRVPEELYFAKYTHRSTDKRIKKTMPGALLCLTHDYHGVRKGMTPAEEGVQQLGLGFYNDFASKKDVRWYKPGEDDMVVHWSGHDGFAIHVRGEQNVARLEALHNAFLAGQVSVADASICGFIRKSLCLVMNAQLPEHIFKEVREKDEAFQRLHDAFKASGIEQKLSEKKLYWYALSPAWEYEEGSALLCFLNPREQSKYEGGWYSLDELVEWTEGKGPIVDGREITKQLKAIDVDFGYHLHLGLEAAGVRLRNHEKYVWLNPEKTQIGVRIRVHRDYAQGMSSGIYPLEVLEPYVVRGRELHLAQEKKAA